MSRFFMVHCVLMLMWPSFSECWNYWKNPAPSDTNSEKCQRTSLGAKSLQWTESFTTGSKQQIYYHKIVLVWQSHTKWTQFQSADCSCVNSTESCYKLT